MYTIQYKDPVTRESRMQDYETRSFDKLLVHVATFPHEIFNVYRDGNMVTKHTRTRLAEQAAAGLLSLNANARNFITNPL